MTLSSEEKALSTGYRPLPFVVKKTCLVTVEPILAFFMFGDGIYYATLSEFVQERIASDNNYTLPNNAVNGTCSINISSTEHKEQTDIQAEASSWIMYFTIAYTLPAIFATMIIGSWSDSVGRKPALIIPAAGTAFNLVALILVAFHNLPLEIIIASSFIRGLCGGTSLFMAIAFSYISDITTKENRTKRIIVCECVFLLAFGSAQLFGGLLLNILHFPITYGIATISIVLTIIYIAIPCFLRETIVTNGSFKDNLKSSVNGLLGIFTEKDKEYKTVFAVLNFVYFIAVSFTLSNAIFGLLTIHFLSEPFCFSYLMMSYYTATLVFAPAIGFLTCVFFLKNWVKDYWLIHIGMCSAIVCQYVSASAKTTPIAFAGAAFGAFKGLFGPPCRSILSKMSTTEEQGTVFGFIGMVDALGNFISPLIINNIYSATVYSMPTFVFWMSGSLSFLPIMAVSYLQYKDIRNKKSIATNSPDVLVHSIN